MNHETDLRNGNYEESGRDSWMACGEISGLSLEENRQSSCMAGESFRSFGFFMTIRTHSHKWSIRACKRGDACWRN